MIALFFLYFNLTAQQDTIFLQNKNLKIKISPVGAELQSIKSKKDNFEYLWQGNPKYWKQKAPWLFPFIGKLWNKSYQYQGKTYQMNTHGFISNKIFSYKIIDSTQVVFETTNDSINFANYPFKFQLQISYQLKDNQLKTTWKVKNTDSKMMYFQMGSHPGFNLVYSKENDSLKSYVNFENSKDSLHYIVKEQNNFFAKKPTKNFIPKLLAITEDLFKNDAIVFENQKINKVTLLNNKQVPILEMTSNSPIVTLWKPKNNAPFLCIEACYGKGDYFEFNEDLSKKPNVIHLKKKKSFSSEFLITFFDRN